METKSGQVFRRAKLKGTLPPMRPGDLPVAPTDVAWFLLKALGDRQELAGTPRKCGILPKTHSVNCVQEPALRWGNPGRDAAGVDLRAGMAYNPFFYGYIPDLE
jgi:hypothetical protein